MSLPEKLSIEVPKSVDTAGNLTDKPTEVLGKTVSSLISLAFGGITNFEDKRQIRFQAELEAYKASIYKKLKLIPEENVIEPKTQIVAQALDDSKFCVEEPALREMFAELIASASDKTKEDTVHPSFSAFGLIEWHYNVMETEFEVEYEHTKHNMTIQSTHER
ncbi:hypothetical protein FACS189490_03210 [Clostridia bacterium]|nr:hypothetical protein FACS189490_03210 [Clostridia bacterium]